MEEFVMNYEYERLVRTMVRMMMRKYETRISEDDLFQEGTLALLKAQKTYQPEKGAKFETYASVVIRNHILDYISAEEGWTDNPGMPDQDPEPWIPYTKDDRKNAEQKKILREILKDCNNLERAIFNAYYQGYSYREICEIFEISKKKVDNTIQKIHRLARSIYAD